jgi:hypothetical protein
MVAASDLPDTAIISSRSRKGLLASGTAEQLSSGTAPVPPPFNKGQAAENRSRKWIEKQ